MAFAVPSFWTFRFRNGKTLIVSKVHSLVSGIQPWLLFSVRVFMLETCHTEVEEGMEMHRWNITGRRVAYLRSQKKWTQERLANKLQCEGVDISRLSVARIEYGVLKVHDTVLAGLQRVFRVPLAMLFPQEIQELDADFAKRIAAQLSNPIPPKIPRRKCQKLTKRPKKA